MLQPIPRFRQSAGFSLIEMIAVLVLIGIVATLVVRNVMPGFTGGQVNAAKAQVNTVASAGEAYYMENGRFPESLRELVQKHLKESQLKDPWKTDIVYRRPGEGGRDFDVISYGKDGKPGGDGDNADLGNW